MNEREDQSNGLVYTLNMLVEDLKSCIVGSGMLASLNGDKELNPSQWQRLGNSGI